MITHKASTGITKRRPFICGFMKVVCIIEVVTQLDTYRHSPDEVRGDFFTTDLSVPGHERFRDMIQKLVTRGFCKPNVSHFHCWRPSSEASIYVSANAPVSFTNAEGKGEVGGYFFKVLQRNISILVLVIIFHDGLQGAREHRKKTHTQTTGGCFCFS